MARSVFHTGFLGHGEGLNTLALKWTVNAHIRYATGTIVANHNATGNGLSSAVTGQPATFTITLGGDNGVPPPIPGPWNRLGSRFIYVWIANEAQIMAAEVRNNGDGTLTASYTSDLPGNYKVYIEDVDLDKSRTLDNVRPIIGSPFDLTISGPSLLDPDSLPICGAEGAEGAPEEFWRKGTWISSNVASAAHGVMRDGWVFQPKSCVYDTFSVEDFMIMADAPEPTWVLVAGTSVQRGIFLSLVDMVLQKGQKHEFKESAFQKCWGWSEIRIGNLRITYQDMRLTLGENGSRKIVCHDEKLASSDRTAYMEDAKHLLQYVFEEGTHWPDVMIAPVHLEDDPMGSNKETVVILDNIPPNWQGHLIFAENMMGIGFSMELDNPTVQEFQDANPHRKGRQLPIEELTKRVNELRYLDPARISFMSTYPMYRHILFEIERKVDQAPLCYGCSIHYHSIMSPEDPSTCGESKMVESMMTEMVANIMLMKAVGSKEALAEKAKTYRDQASAPKLSMSEPREFEMCTDCPSSMLPFHIKPIPDLKCETVASLPEDTVQHVVWDTSRCPDWCLATDPVGQVMTGSGPADVRECG